MIRLVSSTLCAAALIAVLTETSRGAPGPVPVGPSPKTIPPGTISVDSFGVIGSPPNMAKGVISSTSATPLAATYTIFRKNGSDTWTKVQHGSMNISSKAKLDVTRTIKQTNVEQKFRLDVNVASLGISRSKVFSLARTPPVYVIRYGTSGNKTAGHWVLAGVFNTDGMPLNQVDKKANAFAKTMRDDYGFTTQDRIKSSTNLLNKQYYRKSIYIQTDEMLERKFGAKAAAVSFSAVLRRTIPWGDLTIEDMRTK